MVQQQNYIQIQLMVFKSILDQQNFSWTHSILSNMGKTKAWFSLVMQAQALWSTNANTTAFISLTQAQTQAQPKCLLFHVLVLVDLHFHLTYKPKAFICAYACACVARENLALVYVAET